MKRKLAAGGVILVGLGILIGTMTDFFRGLGPGGGAQVSLENSSSSKSGPRSDKDDAPHDSTTDGSMAAAGDVLHVIVDDQHYALREMVDGQSQYRPIDLAELIELAKETKGNADGIRVRIASRESARYTAEARLHDELIKAGLPEQSLFRQKELAP